MTELTETPKCKATREELRHDDENLRLTDECTSCSLLGARCLIASHPSSAGMSYTSSVVLQFAYVSMSIDFSFTSSFVLPSCSKLCTLITSPYLMPFETPIPCLHAEQVMIRLVSFPLYVI